MRDRKKETARKKKRKKREKERKTKGIERKLASAFPFDLLCGQNQIGAKVEIKCQKTPLRHKTISLFFLFLPHTSFVHALNVFMPSLFFFPFACFSVLLLFYLVFCFSGCPTFSIGLFPTFSVSVSLRHLLSVPKDP